MARGLVAFPPATTTCEDISMTNLVPEYYFAPTWDYPPDGSIKLGNIISSSKKPQRPLANIQPPEADVMKSSKSSVTYSKENMNSRDFSILTSFLSFLGAGADAGINRGKSNLQDLSFDYVETAQFNPTDDYLQKCIKSRRVRSYLDSAIIFRKPIYIITGVKIAKGARAKTQTSRKAGAMLRVQVDGTIWSGGTVPIGGGPQVETESSHRKAASWETSQEFVLGYRLSKVHVDHKGAVKTEDEYRKGALLGYEPKVNEAQDYTIVAVETSHPETADGFDIVGASEDGSTISYAIPSMIGGGSA